MICRRFTLAASLAPMLLLATGALSTVHASGFGVFTQGASALGQGNAVTAHTDSPSTVFYNPALMNRLQGTQVEVGTTAIVSSREFDDGAGNATSNTSTFFPSTFYVTYQASDKLSAGFGVFNPFGLGSEWKDDWAGRYIATKSEMQTFDFNPAISYQVTPALSLAAGLDIIYLNATLRNKIFSGTPGADISQKFSGDGTGIGYNLAAAYDVTRDVTVGASYRSEVKVKVDGKVEFSPQVPSPPFPVPLLNTTGRTDFTLPQQLTAGIAYRGIDALVLEAGLRWEGWSSFDKLTVETDGGLPPFTTKRNWSNAWGMNAGAKYRINPTVALSAGYIYGANPVPDSTFDPQIPDADAHIFCVGSEIKYQNATLGLSYAYQMYVDRTKNNSVGANPLLAGTNSEANGKYQSDAHLIALSLGYKF